MIKSTQFKIKGMQQDLSESAFNPEFAFENKNIRITARDSNTLLSITNEKGNKKIKIFNENNSPLNITGLPLGYSTLKNEFVLFTTSLNAQPKPDYIYKLWFKDDNLICKLLYNGNLNFNKENPIETISLYENENIKKIYWLDEKNQPRFINIAADNNTISKWNDYSFDFVQKLKLNERVNASKRTNNNGLFPSGIIQYAFTYYNKYGQESNIFDVTSLNYISHDDRGASPEEMVNVSFDIGIEYPDLNFEYVRIYSILRSSLDSLPTVKIIADIPVKYDGYPMLMYTDNNLTGTIVDPSILLYIGGEDIIANTFTHKDNTLFLGNIKLNRKVLNKDIKNLIKGLPITFEQKSLSQVIDHNPLLNKHGIYPYKSELFKDNREITSFKYLEWYRFGIQFQHVTGKWSEVLWIKDMYNTIKPVLSELTYSLRGSQAKLNINSNIINEVYKLGYIAARGVVVFPNINDREVLAQGVLNPTVYNVQDKFNNSPGNVSSWFFRPLSPYRINSSDSAENIIYGFDNKAIIGNSFSYISGSLEFRHNRILPTNNKTNCEIQCNDSNEYPTNINNSGKAPVNSDIGFSNKYKDYFYVDESIVTFHSPDLEDNSLDNINKSLKLRIIGRVALTGFVGDIDITTSTGVQRTSSPGFYKWPFNISNYQPIGMQTLCSAPLWYDAAESWGDSNNNKLCSWVVFPWHANRSLTDSQGKNGEVKDIRNKLDKKKMSNLRYSGFTQILSTPWLADKDSNHNGITKVNKFLSNEITALKIKAPLNSGLNDIIYYGNYDKVVIPALEGLKVDGYGLTISANTAVDPLTNWEMLSGSYKYFEHNSKITKVKDPVRIRYKSSPHIVFGFNYTQDKKQVILPSYKNYNKVSEIPFEKPFWGSEMTGIYQDEIHEQLYIPFKPGTTNETEKKLNTAGFLWLAELYNDNVNKRFGGDSDEAIYNNVWIPCGEKVKLTDYSGNLLTSATLIFNEGDTYIQRYDCLKTYPFAQEDQNQVVEILSFLCESRINLNGRYDRNRGQNNNLNMSPINFNLFNSVYNQTNNFFNYKTIDYDRFNIDYFPNTITWTKTKTLGELIDSWTNITMANVLDIDGDKGNIQSLNTFNDNIIGFQDKGIFSVLFNSRVQIPTSDGVPIEISNSYKVEGKRYIADNIGTTNKWSIINSSLGLYFIDTLNKSICLFNGNINNLSDNMGFHSWSNNNINNLDSWDSYKFDTFTTFYDSKNKDVYFVNDKFCLCYSELLNNFVSFYDYEKTPFMFNIDNRFISIEDRNKDNTLNIWDQNKGEYNNFFGSFKPYYTTLLVNPDMPYDKIFNNIEFRSDRWNNNILLDNLTFDNLKVWNEYQVGESVLENTIGIPSNLKRKFRVWRANIPRDNNNVLNRIRNPWIYLKLETKKENYDKLILHDLSVSYTI